MVNRFEEIHHLAEMEKKAKPPKIGERLPGISSVMREALPRAIIVDTEKSISVFGEDIAAFVSHEDANHYIVLRNAAPWLLEVAGCFEPGDANEIAYAMDVLASDSRYTGDSRVLRRLLRAAKIIEERE